MIFTRRDLLCIALIILAPIVLNWTAIFGPASDPALLYGSFASHIIWNPNNGYPSIDPTVGFNGEALGHFIGTSLSRVQIPWWNPFEGAGFPTGEGIGNAILFPFSILLGLPNGGAVERCVLEVLAGLATWLLIRQIGGNRICATAGAIVFSLNGSVCWIGGDIATTAPFLPLLILGIERLYREKRGGWALTTASLGLSLLAGFPETAYPNGLLALAWAIVRFSQTERKAAFVLQLTTSGFMGLLLAAAPLIAFYDYLQDSFTGGHLAGAYEHMVLTRSGLTQLFLPYVWGPIFANHSQDGLWSSVGGYAGVGLSALAIAGSFGRRNRTLKLVLLGWVIVTLGATFDAPLLQSLVVHFPLMKYTAYFRYLPTSWEFSLAILASFAIDDLVNLSIEDTLQRFEIAVTLACGLAAFGIFYVGVDLFGSQENAFRGWVFNSIYFALAILIGISGVSSIRNAQVKSALLAAIVVAEACGYFSVPQRGYPTAGDLDMAPIHFLQRNIAYQRFYTLGPIAPNYGSFFQISSVNYNDLPIPNTWLNYIHENMDGYSDPVNFVGYMPAAGPGIPSRAEELRAHVHGFERAGVKFVVAPPDQDPFITTFETPSIPGVQIPTVLFRNTTITYRIDHQFAAGTLSAVDLFQGNYNNSADGTLDVRVCDSHGSCASGSRAMKESSDNQFFHIDMNRQAKIAPTQLTVTISDHSSSHPDAFWTFPASGPDEALAVNGMPVAGKTLRLRFEFASTETLATLAYRDPTLSIFELRTPRPYVAAKDCQLNIKDRTSIEADCSRESSLQRLELLMPGWHANINRQEVPISHFDNAFQSVALPSGHSVVHFWFLPPFVQYGLGALLLSILAICGSILRDIRISKKTGDSYEFS